LSAKLPNGSGSAPLAEETLDEANVKKQFGGEAMRNIPRAGLHYNIQIHLPATKDVEVYNAIFKSLKDHLLD
jgi:hypothetical protein